MASDDAVTESAKAVQETAKTAGKAVDLTHDLGRFIGRVLGTAPEDLAGVAFVDWLRELRYRNAERLRRRTEEIWAERGIDPDQTEAINPKHARAYFDSATEEGEDAIQELWASLLANATDPNVRSPIRAVFILTLKEFEATDALIFDFISDLDKQKLPRSDNDLVKAILERRGISIRATDAALSIDALSKLGCIAKRPTGQFHLTPLGVELRRATRRRLDG